ncbi:cell division protein FtsQ/DivIB [Arthrobacter sp. HLT1-20]
MAEPRKPRVITTRPETARARPGIAPAPVDGLPGNPAEQSTAVRATSSKVSVAPLPVGTPQPAAAPAQPAAGGTVDAGAAAKAAGNKLLAGIGQLFSKPAKPAKPARPVKSAMPVKSPAQDGSAGENTREQPATAPQGQVLAFPMPGHKRRRRNLLLTSLGVAAVVALVMAVALFSPVLGVKTVVFDGQKLVAEKVLQDAVAPLLARPLPQVTGGEVEELLGPIVQVKSSRIEARPPSTLVVHIVERVPVALLKNGAEFILVDQDGVQLAATKDPASVALPLIDGGKAAIGKDTFAAMTAVLANLPQSILGQLANASAKSPDAVELQLADGRKVVWGNASDMVLKAQVLEALLNAPAPTAVPGKPAPVPAKVFDVSAPRHPVTR